jgi:hypothetical protein
MKSHKLADRLYRQEQDPFLRRAHELARENPTAKEIRAIEILHDSNYAFPDPVAEALKKRQPLSSQIEALEKQVSELDPPLDAWIAETPQFKSAPIAYARDAQKAHKRTTRVVQSRERKERAQAVTKEQRAAKAKRRTEYTLRESALVSEFRDELLKQFGGISHNKTAMRSVNALALSQAREALEKEGFSIPGHKAVKPIAGATVAPAEPKEVTPSEAPKPPRKNPGVGALAIALPNPAPERSESRGEKNMAGYSWNNLNADERKALMADIRAKKPSLRLNAKLRGISVAEYKTKLAAAGKPVRENPRIGKRAARALKPVDAKIPTKAEFEAMLKAFDPTGKKQTGFAKLLKDAQATPAKFMFLPTPQPYGAALSPSRIDSADLPAIKRQISRLKTELTKLKKGDGRKPSAADPAALKDARDLLAMLQGSRFASPAAIKSQQAMVDRLSGKKPVKGFLSKAQAARIAKKQANMQEQLDALTAVANTPTGTEMYGRLDYFLEKAELADRRAKINAERLANMDDIQKKAYEARQETGRTLGEKAAFTRKNRRIAAVDNHPAFKTVLDSVIPGSPLSSIFINSGSGATEKAIRGMNNPEALKAYKAAYKALGINFNAKATPSERRALVAKFGENKTPVAVVAKPVVLAPVKKAKDLLRAAKTQISTAEGTLANDPKNEKALAQKSKWEKLLDERQAALNAAERAAGLELTAAQLRDNPALYRNNPVSAMGGVGLGAGAFVLMAHINHYLGEKINPASKGISWMVHHGIPLGAAAGVFFGVGPAEKWSENARTGLAVGLAAAAILPKLLEKTLEKSPLGRMLLPKTFKPSGAAAAPKPAAIQSPNGYGVGALYDDAFDDLNLSGISVAPAGYDDQISVAPAAYVTSDEGLDAYIQESGGMDAYVQEDSGMDAYIQEDSGMNGLNDISVAPAGMDGIMVAPAGYSEGDLEEVKLDLQGLGALVQKNLVNKKMAARLRQRHGLSFKRQSDDAFATRNHPKDVIRIYQAWLKKHEQMDRSINETPISQLPSMQKAHEPGAIDPVALAMNVTAGGVFASTPFGPTRTVLNKYFLKGDSF